MSKIATYMPSHTAMYGDASRKDSIETGSCVEWGDKVWTVFAKSPQGILTLQNKNTNGVPASIVLTPAQAKNIALVGNSIKT